MILKMPPLNSFAAIGLIIAGALFASILQIKDFVVQKERPDIVWQQKKLEKSIAQGSTASEDFGFISNKDLEDVEISITPSLAQYVVVRPFRFDRIAAGSVVRIQTIFTIPEDLAVGSYDGTVHVRLGKRTAASPLPVIINVTPKVVEPPVGELIEIFYDDGTAEAFDFDPILGRAVFSTKFYSGTDPVKIRTVKIFLKIPSASPSPIDVYLWDFNRALLVPPIRVTPTDAAPSDGVFYLVDVSSQNITVQNEFYFGIAWPSSVAPPLLGVDLTQPQAQSFIVILPDTFIPITNANLMIRAIIEKLP